MGIGPGKSGQGSCELSFTTMIKNYQALQSQLMGQVKALSSMSTASPGQFIFLQFQMSNVTQVGESISNLISQVNSIINNAVRNQKAQ
jgi:hypothetical protein